MSIKNPTKEQVAKYGISIRAVQGPSGNDAIMLIEGPGTNNFLKSLEGMAVVTIRLEEAGSPEQAEVLSNMFN